MAGKDAALLTGNPRSGRMRCSSRMDRWQVRELLCSLGDKGSGAGDLCVSSAACTLRRECSPSSVQASAFTIAACTHTHPYSVLKLVKCPKGSSEDRAMVAKLPESVFPLPM